MKLVTSSTALFRWGPDHRFKTELYLPAAYAAQPYDIGVLKGDVFLKGYGDPSLSTPAFQKNRLHIRTSSITTFVSHLKALGVTKIDGRIVGDDTWFDDRRTVSSWKPSSRSTADRSRRSRSTRGSSKASASPTRRATRRGGVRDALEDAGIEVTGGPRTAPCPRAPTSPCTVESAPLSTLLKTLNKESDNFFAEMLLKGLGATSAPRARRPRACASRGRRCAPCGPEDEWRLADGSGLSYNNRLSAAAVAKLLRVMTGRADYPQFHASLSIAGRDGTLRKRMRDTAAEGNFHGKTGTLAVASNLSGYVTSSAGHRVVVSIFMNGGWVNVYRAHRAQDRIAVALAKSRL